MKRIFPEFWNDKFYEQFSDPIRAYNNLPSSYNYYLENKELECPVNCDLDYVIYAWRKAHDEI